MEHTHVSASDCSPCVLSHKSISCKALSSPCVGVRGPPLSHFHITHDIRGYWLMTSTYMIYYTMVIFLCQPIILSNILHMRLRMVDSTLLTPCQSYNDTISWLLVVAMRIVIYSLGIVYEKMIVIVKRILIIFERLGNAVTIGVPETLAFCFVLCYTIRIDCRISFNRIILATP